MVGEGRVVLNISMIVRMQSLDRIQGGLIRVSNTVHSGPVKLYFLAPAHSCPQPQDPGPSSPPLAQPGRATGPHMFGGLHPVPSHLKRASVARQARAAEGGASPSGRFISPGAISPPAQHNPGNVAAVRHDRMQHGAAWEAPHFTSLGDEWDSGDLMYPLDKLMADAKDVELAHWRAWRPDSAPGTCVTSILNMLGGAMEEHAMLGWNTRSGRNFRMNPLHEAFRNPPRATPANTPTMAPAGGAPLTGGCMKLSLDKVQALKAGDGGSSIPGVYYTRASRYCFIELATFPNNVHVHMDAHCFVCWAFHGPPSHTTFKECMHLCGDPRCLNPYHLEWATEKANMLHAFQNGSPRRDPLTGRFAKRSGSGHIITTNPHFDDDDAHDDDDPNNNAS